MPHEVHASIQAALPVEGEKAVALIAGIASAWDVLLAAITAAGADLGHCSQTFTVNETRTKASAKARTPRAPRTPATSPPVLQPATSPPVLQLELPV